VNDITPVDNVPFPPAPPVIPRHSSNTVPSDDDGVRSEILMVRGEPAPPSVTVPPRSDPEHPLTPPPYPALSERNGEAGTVIMLLQRDSVEP
jgi:hypothetical protein